MTTSHPRHPPAKSPLLYTGNMATWQRVLIESDILCKSRVAANGQIACNFDPEFLVRARKLWRFQFPAANMQISLNPKQMLLPKTHTPCPSENWKSPQTPNPQIG